MLRKHMVAGMTSLFLCSGMMIGLPGVADAATTVNIDRNDVAYYQETDKQSNKYEFQYEPEIGVKVGYIITGDDGALLDDDTMGYIRRVLHTKFPGSRYPMERIENIDGHIHYGRRNTGDTYILTEAHDVLAKEFEKLEDMFRFHAKRDAVGDGIYSPNEYSTSAGGTVINIQNNVGNNDAGDIPGFSYGQNTTVHDNSYDFTPRLSTLPKEDYVQFARELEYEGLGGYDYLLIFNIKPLRSYKKYKLFGSTRESDFRLSVRAIDVTTGRYIDRGEYIKRGGSSGFNLPIIGSLGGGPSWRRAMRKAIIDAFIESFDHMPIGKYSVCDNPYCSRRQSELKMEKVFGKSYRHCVKHCNDKSDCSDHMVSYQLDADLPSGYVKGQKNELYLKD